MGTTIKESHQNETQRRQLVRSLLKQTARTVSAFFKKKRRTVIWGQKVYFYIPYEVGNASHFCLQHVTLSNDTPLKDLFQTLCSCRDYMDSKCGQSAPKQSHWTKPLFAMIRNAIPALERFLHIATETVF